MDAKKEKKRRLQLMPEVLPDPTARPADGGPRQRTVANMHRLLALAAASTALRSCPDNTSTPPAAISPPSEVITQQPQNASTAVETPAASGKADAGAPPPPPPTGYGVVDPMPPPYRAPPSKKK